MEIVFANPFYLWFIAAIPLLVLGHFISMKFSTRKALKFANFRAIEKITGQRLLSKNYTLLTLRLVTVFLIILSVSGVALWYETETSESDFMLAIDASGSMLASDYQPNRLESAKSAAKFFVDSLEMNTNIGVVSFAGVSFMKQIPTDDMLNVKRAIENISIELAGGTAIGSAIITSVNLLNDPVRPKVVILLTDGQNNVGPTVEESILYANEKHVTVYTIGVGTDTGSTLSDLNTTFVSKLDSETLQKIADETGGKYYKANNESELSEIYESIAVSGTKKVKFDLSLLFLVIVIIMLFVEWVLVNTKYRTLP
ncbi:MAG: VWA domain-containing protein [Candidatus Aenigmarchaeota archaeon]|nr:VWA domain-containing protein [Candidatus Aenigmarchaeota archaeon]